MPIPWPAVIKAGESAIVLIGKLLGRSQKSAQKDALIIALIASIPVIAKELIPELVKAVRDLLKRKHPAYHDINADVCHAYDDCTIGSKIKPEHRQTGTGDKELCAECRDRILGA